MNMAQAHIHNVKLHSILAGVWYKINKMSDTTQTVYDIVSRNEQEYKRELKTNDKTGKKNSVLKPKPHTTALWPMMCYVQ